MSRKYNELIKSTSTPILIRANGVDFPSMVDIIVKIGTEEYKLSTDPLVVVTDPDDITKLEIKAGLVSSLTAGKYLLHLSVVDANYPSGLVLTDCIINDLEVIVRDIC